MKNYAAKAASVNDWYVHVLDGPSLCAWPRNGNVHYLFSKEPKEPEPPQPDQLHPEVTDEMRRIADDFMESAQETLADPGEDPRDAWLSIAYDLAAYELLTTGGLSVDHNDGNWIPLPWQEEILKRYTQQWVDKWSVKPGDIDYIASDARCILYKEKNWLFKEEVKAIAKRKETERLAKEAKQQPKIFRLIDAMLVKVSKKTTELDLDTKIRKLCKSGLASDVVAQGYLAQEIKDRTDLTLSQARKLVDRVVSEEKADTPKGKSGSNVVGQSDHKDLVAYARIKLEEANKATPTLFRYGSELGRVEHVPEEGTTSATIVNKDGLRASINSSANFIRVNQDGEMRGVSVPMDVVSDLMQEHLPLPYLRQVSNYPQFDEDGNLLAINGYHETGYLYLQMPDDLDLAWSNPAPSQEDVRLAIRMLVEEWLADFPFDGYTRREILVACGIEEPATTEVKRSIPPSLLSFVAFVLQPLVRPIIGKAPTPALLVSKPEAATGATLLVSTAQIIVHGTTSTRTIPKDEDERRKEVFTALRGGDPFLFLDNVTGSVDSPVLASLLTSVTFTGRILGKSEEASIPNNASVVITGNNPRFSRELQRRLSLCRLDARVPTPEKREPDGGWRHSDIEDWIAENRGQLLWALCTLVMNWLANDRPKPAGKPLGSYRAWYEVCGGILEAAGLKGFQSNRNQIDQLAGADDDDPMRELVTQWYIVALKPGAHIGMKDQYVKGIGDQIGLASLCDSLELDLPVAKHVVDNERKYKPTALGQFLSSQAERVFVVDEGVSVRIESGKKTKHGKPWSLVFV